MEQKFGCKHAFHTMYVDATRGQYSVKPCCRTTNDSFYVDNISDIKNHPLLTYTRQQFLDKTNPEICSSCFLKESAGEISKRKSSWNIPGSIRQYQGYVDHDMVDWDIRPGNTCNLKCVMCTPELSSKWMEDRDVYEAHIAKLTTDINNDVDWNYIYEHTKDTAYRIYIAGGEPFYMKNVLNFLKKLSSHAFNRNNTRLVIQTNGTTVDRPLMNVLRLFKKLELCLSVDGIGDVNHYIRFPTDWDLFVQNYTELTENLKTPISFSVTVSALNLPVVQQIADTFVNKISFNVLSRPSLLQINALKPEVLDTISCTIPVVKGYIEQYEYSENLNKKMKEYLTALDNKRNTDSKTILPWCYV